MPNQTVEETNACNGRFAADNDVTVLSDLDKKQTGGIRIALVACPAWESLTPHPALLVLAPVLRSTGTDVSVYDLNAKFWKGMHNHQHLWRDENSYRWNNVAEVDQLFTIYQDLITTFKLRILESNPHLVLFSINSGSRLFTRRFAEELRQDTGVPFVAGGPDCFRSENYSWHVQSGVYQAVCPSEGDSALIDLVTAYKELKEIPTDLPGFTIIKGSAVHDNGDPLRPKLLDELPFVNLSDFELTEYQLPNRLNLMLSRGCINRCSFCSESPNFGFFRSHSAGWMIDQLRLVLPRLAASGVTPHINFNDSLINGNMMVLDELCNRIVSEGLRFTWGGMAYIRPEMSRDFFAKMRQAGCVEICWGVESGSTSVLKLMKKRFDARLLDKVVNDAASVGIAQYGNLIVGFPGEGAREFAETLFFLVKNVRFFSSMGLPLMTLRHNSPIASNLSEYRIESFSSDDWQTVDGSNTQAIRLLRRSILEQVLQHKKFDQGLYNKMQQADDAEPWVVLELEKILAAFIQVCQEYFNCNHSYPGLPEQAV